jgi:hypothetical protein
VHALEASAQGNKTSYAKQIVKFKWAKTKKGFKTVPKDYVDSMLRVVYFLNLCSLFVITPEIVSSIFLQTGSTMFKDMLHVYLHSIFVTAAQSQKMNVRTKINSANPLPWIVDSK